MFADCVHGATTKSWKTAAQSNGFYYTRLDQMWYKNYLKYTKTLLDISNQGPSSGELV